MAAMKGQVLMTLGIILLLVGVVFYLFMFNFVTMNRPVWTMQQLADDYEAEPERQIRAKGNVTIFNAYFFKSVGPGEVVYVRDTVKDIRYYGEIGKSVVWFESSGKGRILNKTELRNESTIAMGKPGWKHYDAVKPFLFFDGDISSAIAVGEEVGFRIKIGGSTESREYIMKHGEPGDDGDDEEDLGLTEEDIIDISMWTTIGLIMIIAGGALLGVGAYFNFVKERAAKEPAKADAASTQPTRQVATGATVKQTKCPACGAAIGIPPGATSIKCGSCGRSYQIGGGAAGRQAPAAAGAGAQQPAAGGARQTKCPGCGSAIAIPPGASTIKCGSCGRSYNIGGGAPTGAAAAQRPAAAGGARAAKCPSCGSAITIPAGAQQVSCGSCGSSFRVG